MTSRVSLPLNPGYVLEIKWAFSYPQEKMRWPIAIISY
jgi:hypothetical protein